MVKNTKKGTIAWIILIVAIILVLVLTYLRFIKYSTKPIEERPVNNSSEVAIQKALEEVVTNFNNSEEIKLYLDEKIKIKAILNNHSIFISYEEDVTTTYEFLYNQLNLEITITNDKENLEKFNKIYSVLLKAIQKRIGNSENIDDIINEIVIENKDYEGIEKLKKDKTNYYKINITKKLTKNNI